MPRDSNRTRIRNCDAVDGRPRGYPRAIGLSRIHLRQMAHSGELPGIHKIESARNGAMKDNRPRARRRNRNFLHANGIEQVDWKDAELLRKFISDRGKIRARRVTGLSPREQKQVAIAIKNAREMALLPYPTRRS